MCLWRRKNGRTKQYEEAFDARSFLEWFWRTCRIGNAKLGIALDIPPFRSGPGRGLSSEPGHGCFLESELGF